MQQPLRYYSNNVSGTLTLLSVMVEFGCKKIVFSSSATVYGSPDSVPIPESAALRPTSPYGHTKYFMEQIMADWGKSSCCIEAFRVNKLTC